MITPAAPAAAATRTQAPRLPRWRGSSSSDHRRRAGLGDDAVRVGLARPAGDGDDLRARDDRRELLDVDDGRIERDVGREPGGQRRQLVRVGRPDAEQLGAEAHRVLDRVKALEHDEPGIAAGAADLVEPHRRRKRTRSVATTRAPSAAGRL